MAADFKDPTRVVRALAAFAREVVGDAADIREDMLAGMMPLLEIDPNNGSRACVSVIGEASVVVIVASGRWELDYTAEGLELARRLIQAAAFGRVVERKSVFGVHTTAHFDDGTSSTSFVGGLGRPKPAEALRSYFSKR